MSAIAAAVAFVMLTNGAILARLPGGNTENTHSSRVPCKDPEWDPGLHLFRSAAHAVTKQSEYLYPLFSPTKHGSTSSA